jgi:hypothetical protein
MPAGRLHAAPLGRLDRDDFSSNRHPALTSYWNMIPSENRCPLFGIMRYGISLEISITLAQMRPASNDARFGRHL